MPSGHSHRAYRLISAFCESVAAGRRVLDAEPALIGERTGLGETVLHYLAVENQLDAIRVLVEEMGADVNTLNDFGESPLSNASSLGYIDLVKYLLSKGAKLTLPGQKECVLHSAVRSSKPELVKLILEAGAAVNEVEDLGETALHVAAGNDDRAEIVRLLLGSGGDLNARRIFDETPLDVAIGSGAGKIAAILSDSANP